MSLCGRLFQSSSSLLLWIFAIQFHGILTLSPKAKNVLVIVGDDAGFESSVYGNKVIETPGQQWLANHGITFTEAYTAVSACAPSRGSILTGLPTHQNGMYGLHHGIHNFNSFDGVHSLPGILREHGIKTGIVGKKHVGPKSVYPFDYEETEENNEKLNQVGRNITNMNLLVGDFLDLYQNDSFFLYIGFYDPHRCWLAKFGGFCEYYGNGEPGMGTIEDWKPKYYNTNDVIVPYFIPDTPAAQRDIAAMYTSINRMDQGIELFLDQFKQRGLLDNTLIIFTSDNGIPFPGGKTNLYDPGMKEPLILSSPFAKTSWNTTNSNLASLLDLVPTILDWFTIPYPEYSLHRNKPVKLTGQSLLPVPQKKLPVRQVFSSHNFHEITMYYPMRVIRSHRYKLIRNLNFLMPFPIAGDLYASITFQDILNRTVEGNETFWYKDIKGYYYRSEYELYDLKEDYTETKNLAKVPEMKEVFDELKFNLYQWMNTTNDPWLCSPDCLLQAVKENNIRWHQCVPLYNDL